MYYSMHGRYNTYILYISILIHQLYYWIKTSHIFNLEIGKFCRTITFNKCWKTERLDIAQKSEEFHT